MENFGLPHECLNKIKEVLLKYPKVERVLIYGSRAKGTNQPGSDIDLAIIAPEMSLSEFLSLYAELEELEIPYMIDLSKFELLAKEVKEHISRVGKTIYERKGSP